jgi:hypothetical protein
MMVISWLVLATSAWSMTCDEIRTSEPILIGYSPIADEIALLLDTELLEVRGSEPATSHGLYRRPAEEVALDISAKEAGFTEPFSMTARIDGPDCLVVESGRILHAPVSFQMNTAEDSWTMSLDSPPISSTTLGGFPVAGAKGRTDTSWRRLTIEASLAMSGKARDLGIQMGTAQHDKEVFSWLSTAESPVLANRLLLPTYPGLLKTKGNETTFFIEYQATQKVRAFFDGAKLALRDLNGSWVSASTSRSGILHLLVQTKDQDETKWTNKYDFLVATRSDGAWATLHDYGFVGEYGRPEGKPGQHSHHPTMPYCFSQAEGYALGGCFNYATTGEIIHTHSHFEPPWYTGYFVELVRIIGDECSYGVQCGRIDAERRAIERLGSTRLLSLTNGTYRMAMTKTGLHGTLLPPERCGSW